MGIQRKLKRIVETATRTHILRTLPRGSSLFYDIATHLPQLEMVTIFDVGANVGQSCSQYIGNFPQADIYCFEPVSTTFSILEKKLRKYKNVRAFQLALGADRGKGYVRLEGPSDMFFLEKSLPEEARQHSFEQVAVDTVDGFCARMSISHINYMKVDAEGGELDILLGADRMLESQAIDLVETETGMNPTNTRHVPFEIVKKMLESKSYFLFGMYEQTHEWPSGLPCLRRVNALFISSAAMHENALTKNIATNDRTLDERLKRAAGNTG